MEPIKHLHLLVRAEVKKSPTSAWYVGVWLKELVGKLNMKICSGPHAEYVDTPGNRGATGVVIIETSHCAIHVWDEPDPQLIQLDVYTCGELDKSVILDMLKRFEPTRIDYKYLDRETGFNEL